MRRTPLLLRLSVESPRKPEHPHLLAGVNLGRAAYGQDVSHVQHRAWSKELGHFITEIVMPRLGHDTDFAWRRLPYVARRIDAMIVAADV